MSTPVERSWELIIGCGLVIFVLVAGVFTLEYEIREARCQSLHESRQFHAVPFSTVRMCYFKPNKESQDGKTKAPH